MEARPVGRYYFLDSEAEELVIVPSLFNAREETRVCIAVDSRPLIDRRVAPGAHVRVPLHCILPLSNHSIALQRRSDDVWVDWLRPSSLAHLGDFDASVIAPAEWGVHEDCIAVLREPSSRTVVARRRVLAGESVHYVHAPSASALMLEFHRPADEKLGLGARLGPTLRWAPNAVTGAAPVMQTDGGVPYTRRTNVTLAPRILRRFGQGSLVTEGYIGAWEDSNPVAEALDFVLGRQEMLFQPDLPEAATRHAGPVIYMGRPHSSWGHFITQGLARAWFAVRHPELPIVWDNPRELPAYQQRVLEMIGLRNQQFYLTEPSHWDEVIFPFPSVCIGDYVTSTYTESVGCVAPEEPLPGKKLFLSRSGTSNFPGGTEGQLDELVEQFGFTVFRPEQHAIEVQLEEISSAEVVLAVEGSSLHTPVLLRDPIRTQFWALSRHRRGTGLFEHIRAAKGLRYETLNFLQSRTRRARDPLDLDMSSFSEALRRTGGLEHSLELLAPYIERPSPVQTAYETHLHHTQVSSSPREAAAQRAQIAIYEGDLKRAEKVLASIT